jgi:hypothetical protein
MVRDRENSGRFRFNKPTYARLGNVFKMLSTSVKKSWPVLPPSFQFHPFQNKQPVSHSAQIFHYPNTPPHTHTPTQITPQPYHSTIPTHHVTPTHQHTSPQPHILPLSKHISSHQHTNTHHHNTISFQYPNTPLHTHTPTHIHTALTYFAICFSFRQTEKLH